MRLSVASLRRVVKGDLRIEFVRQDLTSYGGLELLRRYVRQLGVTARLRTACAAGGGDYGGGDIGIVVFGLGPGGGADVVGGASGHPTPRVWGGGGLHFSGRPGACCIVFESNFCGGRVGAVAKFGWCVGKPVRIGVNLGVPGACLERWRFDCCSGKLFGEG